MNKDKPKYRGRGTDINPPNRFEKLYIDETEYLFDERDYENETERKLETT